MPLLRLLILWITGLVSLIEKLVPDGDHYALPILWQPMILASSSPKSTAIRTRRKMAGRPSGLNRALRYPTLTLGANRGSL